MKRYIAILLALGLSTATFAREVFPLNEGWRFFFKSENSSDNARHVTLPHTWNTDTGAGGYFLETTANYQNDFFVPAEWASKRLFVKFYGVQNVADVFVNGSHVGEHRGGATAFTLEITDKVRFGVDNALVVVVNNTCRTDVLPASTDMNLYGGIYREAELIVTDRTAISPLYFGSDGVFVCQQAVSPELVEGEVQVHILPARGESTCMLNIDITAPDGSKVFTKRQKVRLEGDKPILVPFTVENPTLWSPSSPALYTVTATIGEGQPTDRVSVRTGFRTISANPAKGLKINNALLPIHGVTLYHDNATSGGALTPEDYDADLAQIRLLGANALRSAVMPHAQYLYDRCDEQGIMVWVDSPLHRAPFLGDFSYYSTPQFEQNGLQQLREIIAQNYNHPSVVMWGIFSLMWTRGDDVTPYIKRLNDEAHVMDPSRPTTACSDQDGNINFITDLIVWQQEVGWTKGSTDDIKLWRDFMQKKWSHLRSAIAYGPSGFIGHKSYTAKTAPLVNWSPEQRQTRFHEEYARNLQGDSLLWGVWINNMFDYGSARRPYGFNASGLVTLNRRDRKDAFYLYKALWNTADPTLHITDKRLRLRDATQQSFRIYSSVGQPQLLINKDTVKLHEYAACQYQSDTVTLQGTVRLNVTAGGLRDSVTLWVGNALKSQPMPGLRRTISLQPTN